MNGPDPESAVAWFRVALGDLQAARAAAADERLPARIASFHAAQAAEKALKAAIAFGGSDPPRTHSLLVLAARLAGLGLDEAVDLAQLSDGAWGGRYPDPDEEPLDPETLAELVASAQSVLNAARHYLEESGVALDDVERA